ncbi:hypothetical protein EV421DRAFT_1739789 [Armillaria borealis]|uniref:Uncharacterized protein n=1 Tax=Armillaria borealis TaxID=47425 RepID=A0AA39J4R7_9AGAR|nr:hypothetical protein EV421DRAFT_1739789 [Armillaria borealis]
MSGTPQTLSPNVTSWKSTADIVRPINNNLHADANPLCCEEGRRIGVVLRIDYGGEVNWVLSARLSPGFELLHANTRDILKNESLDNISNRAKDRRFWDNSKTNDAIKTGVYRCRRPRKKPLGTFTIQVQTDHIQYSQSSVPGRLESVNFQLEGCVALDHHNSQVFVLCRSVKLEFEIEVIPSKDKVGVWNVNSDYRKGRDPDTAARSEKLNADKA